MQIYSTSKCTECVSALLGHTAGLLHNHHIKQLHQPRLIHPASEVYLLHFEAF